MTTSEHIILMSNTDPSYTPVEAAAEYIWTTVGKTANDEDWLDAVTDLINCGAWLDAGEVMFELHNLDAKHNGVNF